MTNKRDSTQHSSEAFKPSTILIVGMSFPIKVQY